ncbi:tRNA (N6-threonylcarbamoyladenosine(37)-N6)-methyltransferase TrmO [candidate division KSB1 bacterium]|nr:tRNA (N6-threonylcarbamoyladenosine(37)-N6)-methyltransferase TrmO [candidate division KSB1 bacterium]
MQSRTIHFHPIGVIHSPHTELVKAPIQPVFSKGIKGTIELYPEFQPGLKDLEGFSHIYLLYYFNQAKEVKLQVVPFLDSETRGLFATRAPHRPNKIGMSLVRLIGIQNNILQIEDVDMLDQTPLLDIKPYIQRYDYRTETRSGWHKAVPDDVAMTVGSRKMTLNDLKTSKINKEQRTK